MLIACFILAAFTTVFSCADGGGGGGADGDEATDDDDGGSCDIDDSSMVEIPFSFDGSDCGALGLAIVVDRLYANSSLTAFKVAGQFSIDNDNVFYLRTTGVAQQDPCFDKIENSGAFEIGAGYLECTTNVQVDVVASTDPDASSFCGFWVQSGIACEGGDDDSSDDDDDAMDDDAADDDAADDDAADDDSGDDDGGDYCGDVVAAYTAYCTDMDYDLVYDLVCVTNGNPECLEYCYNAYDDCLDIATCYDTNECVG